jgi:hypothetical protein
MPQAIKHFNGLASSSTTTVYTCPTDTIAIIVPAITIGSSGNGKCCFGWNSSTNAAATTGNLMYKDLDYGITYLVSAVDKYHVQVACNTSTQSYVYFSPNHTSSIDAAYYSLQMPYSNSGANANPKVTGFYTPNTNATSGTDSYWLARNFQTGPWTMSASDKLTIFAQSAFVQYNFLIIEEAV